MGRVTRSSASRRVRAGPRAGGAAALLSEPIRVAVLGSGGREHALALKIADSPLCERVVVIPGNDGMAWGLPATLRAKLEVAGGATDAGDRELGERLGDRGVSLVVVGPDDLLAQGVVDRLESQGFLVFGPRKSAARIEWSKSFAKEILAKAAVPTARHCLITAPSASAARATALARAVEALGGYPLVLKHDGLALGKGVRVCASAAEAEGFLDEALEQGKLVLAEEFLPGHEVSLFALTDGATHAMLEPACDHKRLLDGDQGPNTGGMGAYSPVPWMPIERARAIGDLIFPPVLKELRKAGAPPYRGLLYAGLMVRGSDFRVLEFNARFGDPETQAILPRMESDLLPLLYGVACGEGGLARHLDVFPPRWSPLACVNLVAASRGYPGKPEIGLEIRLGAASEPALVSDSSGARIYFAGVRRGGEGLVTSGGRVLGVSALGASVEEARAAAMGALERVRFDGMQFRRDIGRVRTGI